MGRAFLVTGADFSSNNLGTVTPKGAIVLRSIAISGPSEVSAESQQYTASLSPAWTTQKTVVWSVVSGNQYASITNDGLLVVVEGTISQNVTIRCTSEADSSIYAEKTVTVTYTLADFVQTDFLQNTGASYLFLNDFAAADMYGATIEIRGLITNQNGYLAGYRQDYENLNKRFAMYVRSDGKWGYLLGSSDFKTAGTLTPDGSVFRYVFKMSSSSTSKTATLTIYKGSSTSAAYTVASGTYICYMGGSISIFGFGRTPHGGPNSVNAQNAGVGKFYGLTITKNGNIIANYVPGTIEGVPCIKNTVTGQYFLDASSNNDLIAGNDE